MKRFGINIGDAISLAICEKSENSVADGKIPAVCRQQQPTHKFRVTTFPVITCTEKKAQPENGKESIDCKTWMQRFCFNSVSKQHAFHGL